MERCLACEAVVSRGENVTMALACAALCRSVMQTDPRLGVTVLTNHGVVVVRSPTTPIQSVDNTMACVSALPLLNTASQARQRSTGGDPSTASQARQRSTGGDPSTASQARQRSTGGDPPTALASEAALHGGDPFGLVSESAPLRNPHCEAMLGRLFSSHSA